MPEDTDPQSAPDSDAPAQPATPALSPGQLLLQIGDNGFAIMSVAIANIGPEQMNAVCKEWLLTHNPGLIKEIVEEHVARMQAQKNRLTLVTDPATVRKINSKSRNRMQA
jgi:hypothetical protein